MPKYYDQDCRLQYTCNWTKLLNKNKVNKICVNFTENVFNFMEYLFNYNDVWILSYLNNTNTDTGLEDAIFQFEFCSLGSLFGLFKILEPLLKEYGWNYDGSIKCV